MPYKDPVKRREYLRFYHSRRSRDDPEFRASANDRARQWAKANRARRAVIDRRAHLKHKYGLTEEKWREILAAQNHSCAICRSPDPRWRNDWIVDHCHVTGKVRGILCHHCNLLLGRAKDSREYLAACIEYLARGGED